MSALSSSVNPRKLMYSIAFGLLALSLVTAHQAGLLQFTPQAIAFTSGITGLLLLLVLSSQRSGGHISTSFIFTRAILGIAAMAVSLYYSWSFISYGAVGVGVAVAAIFVLVTEGSKILLTSDVAFYSATGQGEKTVWSGIMTIILFCLSISATVWNLQSSQAAADGIARQSSDEYKALSSRLDNVRASLEQARTDKAACPANYRKNCIDPATRRIDELQKQEAQAVSDLQAFKPVSSGGDAFWLNLSEISGYSVSSIETIWGFLRGFLLEILGLMLIAQASAGARVSGLMPETVQAGYASSGKLGHSSVQSMSSPPQQEQAANFHQAQQQQA